MLAPPWLTLAVIRAVVKKTAVAISERGERRDRPQSMWPEVQPRPFWFYRDQVSSNALFGIFFDCVLTFVPQPSRNPTPKVVAAEANVCGGRG